MLPEASKRADSLRGDSLTVWKDKIQKLSCSQVLGIGPNAEAAAS